MYRVALILAVLAAIGSLALSFTVTKPKIEGLVQERADLQANLATAEAAKTEAEKKAKAATAVADKKTAELAATQKDLETAAEAAKTQRARADKYFADYNKTLAEKNSAQEQLAQWSGTGLKPDQVLAMKAELKATKDLAGVLSDEKSILQRNVASLKNKLAKYEDESQVVAMPGLKGSVVAVDPKWEFVVISARGRPADGPTRRQTRRQGQDRLGRGQSERGQRAARMEAGRRRGCGRGSGAVLIVR